MRCRKYRLLVMAIALLLSFPQNVMAYSTPSKIYYYSGTSGDCGAGTTQAIKTYLEYMGYDSTIYSNKSKATVLSGMSAGAFHIVTHGFDGGFLAGHNGSGSTNYIRSSDITSSLSNTKFVFIEACLTGASDTFQRKLSTQGVKSSLAFRDEVYAIYSTDRSHYYAKQVYYYLELGYTLSQSASYAECDLYATYNGYYGCDNRRVFGGATTM